MRLRRIGQWLPGYVTVEIEGGFPERMLNELTGGGIAVWRIRRRAESVRFCCLAGDYRRLRRPAKRAGVRMRGFIVSELCDTPSNWQMKKTLDQYLDEQGVTGLCGVDTRALTRHVREYGTLRGRIVEGEPTEADLALVRAHEMHDQVAQCTCKEAYDVQGDGAYTIAVLDFGLKRGILRSLLSRGCTLRVFPADTDAQTILDSGCDGVMLTNGPGDPQDNPKAIKTIRELMGKKPMFGICLGHQLMALAMGGRTVQMKYGHHGANHPVKDLARGTCSVTAQNHGFMVDPDQLPAGAVVSHLNWNDQTVEGVRYTDKNAFSVQFHPEACGGPCETAYLFDDFIAMIKANNVQ